MTGPLPGALAPVTVPLSWAYGGVIRLRNRWYDGGGRSVRIDRPVISVGNVTAGGSGKSPVVAWLADALRARGHTPVIAMRGYAARPGEASDEQADYADRLPGVPVVTGADRAAALGRFLATHTDVDCVLLDDGFQHRRLHRDLDLVLVDATRASARERLLPAGFLREPASSLARADAVVITRGETCDAGLADAVARHHGRPPLAWSRHVWTHLRVLSAAGQERVDPAWLRGKRVVTLLGVGHPASVAAQVRDAGAEIVADLPARDHERFAPAKLDAARERARGLDGLVMTSKDWARTRRLIDLAGWSVPIIVPALAIDVFAGADALINRVTDAIT